MIEILCIFFPGILATSFYEFLNKTKLTNINYIKRFFINCIFINIISMITLIIYYKTNIIYTYFSDLFTIRFALIYLLLSTCISLFIGFIEEIFSQKIQIYIEVKRNKK